MWFVIFWCTACSPGVFFYVYEIRLFHCVLRARQLQLAQQGEMLTMGDKNKITLKPGKIA